MADKKQTYKKLQRIQPVKIKKEIIPKQSISRIVPSHTESNNLEQSTVKERAVNPMAIRPPNIHVTLTEEKPEVNLIKKLFGF